MPLVAQDDEVRLLPPSLPLLPHRTERTLEFRPRAELGAGSGTPGDRSGSAAASSSASSSPPGIRVNFSAPKAFGIGLGIGAGSGALFAGTSKATLWPFLGRGRRTGASNKNKKRILIMMSNTGGGHRASAEAIKAGFEEKYGSDYEVLIEDMWVDHCPAPFNKMPDSYSFLVKHSFLWWSSYQFMQPKWVHVPYLRMVHLAIGKSLAKAFDELRPDLVVSVHPLMQHVPLRVLRSRIRSGLQAPTNFATVVTDFTTCHNTWFHPDATRCFVPTDYCKGLARKNGLKEEQIIQHGLPIRPIFSKPLPPKRRLRSQLGMELELPAVLLVGGGEGMGKLEDTVDQLAVRSGGRCQVVVICGRNKKLLARLQAKDYPSGMPVHAVGFVNNIHQYMAAADAIVTKAGPGTIAEALISGLPILLNGNVPCQEEGNIPYVIDNGVGAFETKPPKIASILDQWLSNEHAAAFAEMAKKSKALGRPDAVYRIVEDLATLAHDMDFEYGPCKAVRKQASVAMA